VPESYTRYLANVFRREFDLFASPVAVEYRTDANPFVRLRGRPEPNPEKGRGRRKRD
jgi:hypothetical protein